MNTPEEKQLPALLPSLAGSPRLAESLRRSVEVLRDRADDPAVRQKLDEVLRGRTSLREAVRDPLVSGYVDPLSRRAAEDFDRMSPEQREELFRQGRAQLGED